MLFNVLKQAMLPSSQEIAILVIKPIIICCNDVIDLDSYVYEYSPAILDTIRQMYNCKQIFTGMEKRPLVFVKRI